MCLLLKSDGKLSCAFIFIGTGVSRYVTYCKLILYSCDLQMQGWLSVCSSITVYAPSILCVSSHMYWGLLLTCHIVERHVDVLCCGYGWFSEWINAVVGCSGSLMYALCPDGSFYGSCRRSCMGLMNHIKLKEHIQ